MKDELIEFLRQEAIQLRLWAVQSRQGGWSTHQVDPMRKRAEEIDELLARAAREASWA